MCMKEGICAATISARIMALCSFIYYITYSAILWTQLLLQFSKHLGIMEMDVNPNYSIYSIKIWVLYEVNKNVNSGGILVHRRSTALVSLCPPVRLVVLTLYLSFSVRPVVYYWRTYKLTPSTRSLYKPM